MFDQFSNRLTVQGWLVAETALRVGTGRATEPVGTDLPVMRDELGRPFIPGSSLKGALRANIESLIRGVVDGRYGACIPTGKDKDRCLPANDIKKGGLVLLEGMSTLRNKSWDDAQMADEVWHRSCLVCRTFGSPWLASHVQVKDLAVDKARWFGQYQVRDGVAIDRDTETAASGLLYDYEVVPADTRFACQIVAENMEEWQLGLLWLALQPFVKGQASLGGFRSRGLGHVRLVGSNGEGEPRLYYFDLAGNDPIARLIDFLSADEKQGALVNPETPPTWVTAFKGKLQRVRDQALQEVEDA